MEKQYLNVLNTFTNKYEIVEVSEKVYKEYMRSGWNIKDNDKSFFKHQIQISSLIGNQNDSYENFDEYALCKNIIIVRYLTERTNQ